MDTDALRDEPVPRDNELIARSLTDPDAFAGIFDRHFGTIHRYLARRAGPDAADDLASDVFVVAFGRRADFDPSYEHSLPWLYGIAGNLLSSNRRRLHRDVALLARHPAPDSPLPFEDRVNASLDARREVRALERRLRRLSQADLDTLLLYSWEDLSYPEIAVALQIPVGTVRSRLNRLRRKLREPEADELTRTRRQQAEPGQGDGHG
ncbi:RNA polymerase sigma factor [Rhodococcus sp. UNC363MFTsu5.1]|uniref:RNA polymerase sigma factor n=1 Tax=Rhodococcus sp. UNC363MFTsu5.1 TaxID=1449069 RepID=UPI000A497194|nr:RNA polymerase sigma factor [Rhodococcus sp. UNC363MFTsu5.1]